jgi:rhomboid family GlyGly-CTERM serine protease
MLASLNCDGRYGFALLGGCAALLVPELAGDRGRALLRYERDGITGGEYWRLLTGHLVHLDLQHALLNTLGLVLMWALFARDYRPAQWLFVLLAALAAIDVGLWYRSSTLQWYVGSSGVLHGVMAAGTMAHLRRGDRDGWVLAGALLVKLAYEQWFGALPLVTGAAVAVDAHLYGVLGGAAAATVCSPKRAPRSD